MQKHPMMPWEVTLKAFWALAGHKWRALEIGLIHPARFRCQVSSNVRASSASPCVSITMPTASWLSELLLKQIFWAPLEKCTGPSTSMECLWESRSWQQAFVGILSAASFQTVARRSLLGLKNTLKAFMSRFARDGLAANRLMKSSKRVCTSCRSKERRFKELLKRSLASLR